MQCNESKLNIKKVKCKFFPKCEINMKGLNFFGFMFLVGVYFNTIVQQNLQLNIMLKRVWNVQKSCF